MKSGIWNQVLTYLYLRKRDPNDPRNVNIFLMHSMNRISLFMFLIGLIFMLFKIFRR